MSKPRDMYRDMPRKPRPETAGPAGEWILRNDELIPYPPKSYYGPLLDPGEVILVREVLDSEPAPMAILSLLRKLETDGERGQCPRCGANPSPQMRTGHHGEHCELAAAIRALEASTGTSAAAHTSLAGELHQGTREDCPLCAYGASPFREQEVP